MEQTKRLFVGTFLQTEKLLTEYPNIKKEFKTAISGKWVEEYNLHFTYHFLGNVESKIIPFLLDGLSPILKEYKSELALKGLGCFPSLRSPRVLFVNLRDDKGILKDIHKDCAKVLDKFNIELERREYHPHLTLIRIKTFKIGLFQRIMEKYFNLDLGTIDTFRVNLIESQLTKDGPIYKTVE